MMKSIGIVGSGPAALMAADVLSASNYAVSVFEKKKGPGRKLLIAGSSGLNITNALPLAEFSQVYGDPADFWKQLLQDFSPQDWIQFIQGLGLETFLGTSGRYFVKEMKASKLLRAWLHRLNERKVQFYFEHEFENFEQASSSGRILLSLSKGRQFELDAICLCLGGGSYEPTETPLRWPKVLIQKSLKMDEFTSSNVGYQVAWREGFLKDAEGLPLKNVRLTSSRGTRKGDLIITKYGMEGTPVYTLGEVGEVSLDLKPDLTLDQIISKCKAVKENFSPFRRVKKQLNLCPAALALLFHMDSGAGLKDLTLLAKMIKNFPIRFLAPQALTEAISSAGGLQMSELNQNLMLKKYPGVFAAGEMLNWDAPTGGFLIQACVSQGYRAGQGILQYLARNSNEL
jgi:uncharacterized flavoprotein (TIGR03862 family)